MLGARIKLLHFKYRYAIGRFTWLVISNTLMASYKIISHLMWAQKGCSVLIKCLSCVKVGTSTLILPFILYTDGTLLTIFVDTTADTSVPLPSTSETADTAEPFVLRDRAILILRMKLRHCCTALGAEPRGGRQPLEHNIWVRPLEQGKDSVYH